MKAKYIELCLVIVNLLAGCSEKEIINNDSQEQSVQVVLQAYSGSNGAPASRLAF